MQKQAGDFLVSRTLTLFKPGGDTIEVYELPNGQWQIGKGRDATVITSLDQVQLADAAGHPLIDANSRASLEAWVTKMQSQTPPTPVLQGQTPVLAGVSARDQLSQAIANMPEEVVNRLLTAVVQTVGPVADSIKQGLEINSHGDGYGHTAVSPPAPAFQLPPGARWNDPNNRAAGYLTPMGMVDEKGIPMEQWHPSPEFAALQDKPEPTPIMETAPLHVHVPEPPARGAEELVGAGSSRRSTRRR
jgi:hypothetical protein